MFYTPYTEGENVNGKVGGKLRRRRGWGRGCGGGGWWEGWEVGGGEEKITCCSHVEDGNLTKVGASLEQGNIRSRNRHLANFSSTQSDILPAIHP
jgi:hypothetical protein